jgi:hypothetical protein
MAGRVKTIQINLGNIEVVKLLGAVQKSKLRQRSGFYFSICPLSGAAWQKKTAS